MNSNLIPSLFSSVIALALIISPVSVEAQKAGDPQQDQFVESLDLVRKMQIGEKPNIFRQCLGLNTQH